MSWVFVDFLSNRIEHAVEKSPHSFGAELPGEAERLVITTACGV